MERQEVSSPGAQSSKRSGSSKRWFRALILTSAFAGVLYFANQFGACRVGDVSLFETPEIGTIEARLLLRSERDGSGALLIKNSMEDAVYAYDAEAESLSLVPVELWHQADGTIAENCGGRVPSTNIWLHTSKSGTLCDKEREVVTAGTRVVKFRPSPSDKVLAVLSADGFGSPSVLPFSGPGGVFGQHYHQLFSLPDLKPIGKTVWLWFNTSRRIYTICWSPDERFVVYADPLYFRISVVPVDLNER